MRRMAERFRRHAASPQQVTEAILRGVERERYLVLTGTDIKLLVLLQRLCPPAYAIVMRRLNDVFVRAVSPSRRTVLPGARARRPARGRERRASGTGA
jgi:hypothetical protein